MRSLLLPLLLLASTMVSAYKVSISSDDNERQVCSGMYAGPRKGGQEGENARIDVSFEGSSAGQIALVIYEWSDVQYLGAVTPSVSANMDEDDYLPKTYICTTSAVRSKLCDSSALGQFIVVFPSPSAGVNGGRQLTLNDTSIFTQSLRFREGGAPSLLARADDDEDEDFDSEEEEALAELKAETAAADAEAEEDNGIPLVTGIRHGKGAAPAKTTASTLAPTMTTEPAFSIATGSPAKAEAPPSSSPPPTEQVTGQQQQDDATPWYDGGVISYELKKTGYYCVGTVPVTLLSNKRQLSSSEDRASTPIHAEYQGEVAFLNVFQGELPAGDWPKISFYLLLTGVYFALAVGWGLLCYRYRDDLLPIQHYVSGTLVYIFVEMLVFYVYYKYINRNGFGAGPTAFLLVVAILNAGRNSLSFFLLLVVSMGLSVVTPTLGSVMQRVKLLAIAHFVFGVIYSIGTVEISLETASLLLILSLIVGLSFTLTSFLMWTIISLNGTILHLEKRKQTHKLQMFTRLYRILMAAVIAIAGFFVVSTISLSDRTSEDYAPNNWKIRWILLDGSLSLIYLAVFVSIAFLWRPTGHNQYLAMADEVAQDEDEADAEDFELSRVRRGGEDDDEEVAVGGGRPDHPDEDDEEADKVQRGRRDGGRRGEGGVEDGRVVFAIDDEDDEDDEAGERAGRRVSGERGREANEEEEAGEGERLVAGARGSKRDD